MIHIPRKPKTLRFCNSKSYIAISPRVKLAGRSRNINNVNRQKGFTLLEVIIAFTLSAALVLAVMMVFKNISTNWVRSDALVTNAEADLLGMQFVRRILGDTLPVNWASVENKSKVAFVGKNKSVSFIARLPVANSEALGLFLYTLTVETTKYSSGSALVISYRQINWESFEETASVDPKKEVILDKVKSIKFSYFGVKQLLASESNPELENNISFESVSGDNPEEGWSDDWEDQANLPRAIKISIVRNNKQNKDDDDYVALSNWDDVVIRLPFQHIR